MLSCTNLHGVHNGQPGWACQIGVALPELLVLVVQAAGGFVRKNGREHLGGGGGMENESAQKTEINGWLREGYVAL